MTYFSSSMLIYRVQRRKSRCVLRALSSVWVHVQKSLQLGKFPLVRVQVLPILSSLRRKMSEQCGLKRFRKDYGYRLHLQLRYRDRCKIDFFFRPLYFMTDDLGRNPERNELTFIMQTLFHYYNRSYRTTMRRP